MILKTGDRVKFLNEVGGGILISFLDKTKGIVRTTDGFEIPVILNQLIADSGNYLDEKKPQKQEKHEEQLKKEEIKSPPKVNPLPDAHKALIIDDELCFAILRKPQSSDLFAYMINNSSYNIHYVISIHGEEETLLFDQGSMDSGTQMKIRKFIPENLNQIMRFDIHILFYKDSFFIQRDPVSMAVFINPAEVYSGKALAANDYFDGKALVFTIFNFNKKSSFTSLGGLNISELLKEKSKYEKPNPAAREEKKTSNGPEEVDLHIESITDNYAGLSNSEIVDLQMARFKIALDTAVIHKTRSIVFIHGVGNGKLKFTLRKALDDKFPDLQYQDASFKEYGYGATMVIIP
jgi:hypothetical protein